MQASAVADILACKLSEKEVGRLAGRLAGRVAGRLADILAGLPGGRYEETEVN